MQIKYFRSTRTDALVAPLVHFDQTETRIQLSQMKLNPLRLRLCTHINLKRTFMFKSTPSTRNNINSLPKMATLRTIQIRRIQQLRRSVICRACFLHNLRNNLRIPILIINLGLPSPIRKLQSLIPEDFRPILENTRPILISLEVSNLLEVLDLLDRDLDKGFLSRLHRISLTFSSL